MKFLGLKSLKNFFWSKKPVFKSKKSKKIFLVLKSQEIIHRGNFC